MFCPLRSYIIYPGLSASVDKLNFAKRAGSQLRTIARLSAAYCRLRSGFGMAVGLAIWEISSFCSGVSFVILWTFPWPSFPCELGGVSYSVMIYYQPLIGPSIESFMRLIFLAFNDNIAINNHSNS